MADVKIVDIKGNQWNFKDEDARNRIKTIEEKIGKNFTYSTEEIDTGKKWINGKKIYRKTFFSANNWTSGTKIGIITNIDMVIEIRDIVCATDNRYSENFGYNNYNAHQVTVGAIDGDVVAIRVGVFASNNPSTVTIEYTKTTDEV